jgi:uncharacterized protein YjiS (DUF1127 family)
MNTTYAIPTNSERVQWGLAEARRLGQRAARRFRAIARLMQRRRRAARNFADLSRLDERTLRDLGLTRSELASVNAELGGVAAVTRRRADLEVWQSASSSFRIRAVDTSL